MFNYSYLGPEISGLFTRHGKPLQLREYGISFRFKHIHIVFIHFIGGFKAWARKHRVKMTLLVSIYIYFCLIEYIAFLSMHICRSF